MSSLDRSDSKQRLDEIIWGTNVGTWEWNVQTGETIFSERWTDIVGYTLEELSPISINTWIKLAHPDDLKKSGELLEKNFSRELDYYEFEGRMRHKNGEWVWVLDRGKVVEWTEDGKPLRMSGTHSDITGRKRTEEALQASEQQLNLILSSLPDLIWLKNETGVYLNCNQMFERYFGVSKSQIIGKTDYDFVDAETASSFRQHDIEVMEADQPLINEEWITFADGGHRVLLETTKTPLKNHDGATTGVLGIGHDITERKELENTNWTMAMTDSLTGLANRAQFDRHLLPSIELAKRENKPLALMMLDLDYFKPVNDTYGHPVGDAVLQAVASILTKLTRGTDVVARLGGDEFAILVVHPDGKVGVGQSAKRIIEEIKKPMQIEGHSINIGVSIGIALYPENTNSGDELKKKSDLALYEVKERGRGSFLFYQPEMDK